MPEINAVCSGLYTPIDNLADTTLEYIDQIPDEVIVSITTVVSGYDGGCIGKEL